MNVHFAYSGWCVPILPKIYHHLVYECWIVHIGKFVSISVFHLKSLNFQRQVTLLTVNRKLHMSTFSSFTRSQTYIAVRPNLLRSIMTSPPQKRSFQGDHDPIFGSKFPTCSKKKQGSLSQFQISPIALKNDTCGIIYDFI